MSAPVSWISICSGTRLNNRYIHTAYFKNRAEQSAWFNSKVVKEFNGYTTLRRNWPIKVQATMQEAEHWDYLFFANPTEQISGGVYHTGRIYYYFITGVQYVNDSTVELSLELDVIQTYLTDFQMLPCYVERMHTTNDTIGNNTVDEGLAVDEFIINSEEDTTVLKDLCILVQATEDPGLTTSDFPVYGMPYMYNDVFSGIRIYAVNSADWQLWGHRIDNLNTAGKTDCIISMWMYPKALVKLGGESDWGDSDLCKTVGGADFESITIDGCPDNLNGYKPRNKKLFCYPYSFLYVTNNNGGTAVYRYERFRGSDGAIKNTLNFLIHGTLGDSTAHLFPGYYNGVALNYHEGLTLGGFPTCAWDSDTYKLWLAQNQNQHTLAQTTAGLKIVGGVSAGIAGLLTGNVAVAGAGAGVALNGVSQIMEMEAQRADMEITPPQARGAHSASVNVSYGKQLFTFQRKSISYEFARKIDDFFTMYGYRLGRCEVPRYDHRKSHCYVKTVDCKISGSFCTEDSAKIESIFDKGVTFWRNPDGLGDYSRDNAVV